MREIINPLNIWTILLIILAVTTSINSQQVVIGNNNLEINCDDPEDNCPGARQLVLDGIATALRAQCPECNFEQVQNLQNMIVPTAQNGGGTAAAPAPATQAGNGGAASAAPGATATPRPSRRNILSLLFQNLMKAQKAITSRFSRSRGQGQQTQGQSAPARGSRRSRQQQQQPQQSMQSRASGFRERLAGIFRNIFSRRRNAGQQPQEGQGQQRRSRGLGRLSRRADSQSQSPAQNANATPKPMGQMTRMTNQFLQQLRQRAGAFILGAWQRVSAGRSRSGARANQNQAKAPGTAGNGPRRKLTVTLN